MVRIHHNFDKLGPRLANLVRDYGNAVLRDVDIVLSEKSEQLESHIKEGWPVGPETGRPHSRDQWERYRRGYAHYELVNPAPHAIVIENGGYIGVGPKTAAEGPQLLPGNIAVGGGIFPTQVPSHPVARGISRLTLELNEALAKAIRQ